MRDRRYGSILALTPKGENGMQVQDIFREARVVVAGLALAVFGVATAHAQAKPPASDEWKFSVMPYLWLPSINGTLRYGPPATNGATPTVSMDNSSVLSDLDMAFMIMGVVQKGRWSIATDYLYADIGTSNSAIKNVNFNPGPGPINVFNTSLNLGTQSDLKASMWTLVGGYEVVQEPKATLSVIGGFRYLDITATTNWRLGATVNSPVGGLTLATTGGISQSDELWDAVVGVRGRLKLGEGNWFAPYYLDAGAGDAKFTWQGMAGIGYSFRWGEVVLAYRYLTYEQSGNKLIEDLTLQGFGLGVNFRF